jgi:NADH-quinone oxidoreductase subunit J
VIQAAVFYLFAFIVCASGLMVILARNPVHSVLWLILAFFNAAGLFLVIGAEFLAMILVIVYVGAVAVLFLFVVMMLDVDFATMRSGFARYLPFGLLLGLVLAVELILVAGAWAFGDLTVAARAAPAPGPEAGLSNTQAIGTILYTDYVFAFQLAGMILLTAMVGAIVLTLRHRPGVKRQDVAKQNARTPASAVTMTRPATGAGVDTGAGVRLPDDQGAGR